MTIVEAIAILVLVLLLLDPVRVRTAEAASVEVVTRRLRLQMLTCAKLAAQQPLHQLRLRLDRLQDRSRSLIALSKRHSPYLRVSSPDTPHFHLALRLQPQPRHGATKDETMIHHRAEIASARLSPNSLFVRKVLEDPPSGPSSTVIGSESMIGEAEIQADRDVCCPRL